MGGWALCCDCLATTLTTTRTTYSSGYWLRRERRGRLPMPEAERDEERARDRERSGHPALLIPIRAQNKQPSTTCPHTLNPKTVASLGLLARDNALLHVLFFFFVLLDVYNLWIQLGTLQRAGSWGRSRQLETVFSVGWGHQSMIRCQV